MYLQTVLWTYAAIQVLHVYLDLRQLRALRQPKPPPQLSHYTEDEYKRTQAYNLDKWCAMCRTGADYEMLTA